MSAEDRLGPPLLDFHQEGEVKRACAQFLEIRLWDLFAAAALAGILANHKTMSTTEQALAAEEAAGYADDLLAEHREREDQKK